MNEPKKNGALESFRGHVANTIPAQDIGWIRCTEVNGEDSSEILFFHLNYTKAGRMPAPDAAVKGTISRTADPTRQDRAMNVEVVDGEQ